MFEFVHRAVSVDGCALLMRTCWSAHVLVVPQLFGRCARVGRCAVLMRTTTVFSTCTTTATRQRGGVNKLWPVARRQVYSSIFKYVLVVEECRMIWMFEEFVVETR